MIQCLKFVSRQQDGKKGTIHEQVSFGYELMAVRAISQALNVAMSLSTFEKKKVKSLSRVRLFATPWTVAYQAPPSMGFSSQEYWSRLPFPSPGDLPNPGIEPRSPALEADTLTFTFEVIHNVKKKTVKKKKKKKKKFWLGRE